MIIFWNPFYMCHFICEKLRRPYNLCNNFQFRPLCCVYLLNFCTFNRSMMLCSLGGGRGWMAAVSNGGEKTRKHSQTQTLTHNPRYFLMNKCSIINSPRCAACRPNKADRSRDRDRHRHTERKLKHCTKSIKQINYTENLAQHWIDCAKWNYKILHSIRAFFFSKWYADLFVRTCSSSLKMPLIYSYTFSVHTCTQLEQIFYLRLANAPRTPISFLFAFRISFCFHSSYKLCQLHYAS